MTTQSELVSQTRSLVSVQTSFFGPLFPSPTTACAWQKHLIHASSMIITTTDACFILSDSWLLASYPLGTSKNPTSWAQEEPCIKLE